MGGESIYYGLNALSNNLIMADRKKLKNPHGLIVGTPGAGKSFAAKREITNVFIVTKDDIITVSYTHLDVYKRQGQILPGMCRTHEADQRRKAQAETTGEMSRFRG